MADFASEVIPLLRAEVMALHSGDPGPRKALWSHGNPLTPASRDAIAARHRKDPA